MSTLNNNNNIKKLNSINNNNKDDKDNEDVKSTVSSLSNDDDGGGGGGGDSGGNESNGKLKIDIPDEDSLPAANNNETNTKTTNGSSKKQSNVTPSNSSTKLDDKTSQTVTGSESNLDSTVAGSSQASNESDDKKSKSKRRPKDRGLDGGYWSRMDTSLTDTLDTSGTRNKRRRTTVERFEYLNLSNLSRLNQSADESIHSADDSKAQSTNDQEMEDNRSESNTSISKSGAKRFILFKSKSFLTVRNETGTFFLCQAVNSIYEDSKKCKIQWLEDAGPNKYKYGYVDWVDPFAIISKVNVKRIPETQYFKIEDDDLKKVNNLLEIAIKDGGITVEFDSDDDQESNDKVSSSKANTDSNNLLANSEFYDKEEDEEMSSSESSDKKKKSKKGKDDQDSDFKLEESDLEEAKKDAKIKIPKKDFEIEKLSSNNVKKVDKQDNNKLHIKSAPTTPIINTSNNKTSSKSSIEIKKVNKPLISKTSPDKLVVSKKVKKIIDSDDDQDVSSKKSISITTPITNGQQKTTKSNEVVVSKKKLIKEKNDNDTDELDSDKEAKKPRLNVPSPKDKVKKKDPTATATTVTNNTTAGNSQDMPAPQGAVQQNVKKRRLLKIVSNRSLEENQKVQVLTNDPFFEETLPTPFISPLVQSKLAFRAIYLGDMKLLKSLIDDVDRVPSLHVQRSVYNKWTPAQYAIYMENKPALEMLIDDFLNPKTKRVQVPETMFEKFSTGIYNPKSLGVQFTRKLTESRGAKEGNQALSKDNDALKYKHNSMTSQFFRDLFEVAFEYGCSVDMFDFLLAKWKASNETKSVNSGFSNPNYMNYESQFIYENIYKAVLYGHRKLAAHVLENAPPGHGFNAVHTEVLKAENDCELKCQLRSNQCTKKPYSNDLITPIHCASINPNVKYLKTLLSITQDFNIADKKGRRPVHFAAVCEGPTPLEYLITRVSPYELDSLGNTPLHYACLAGRSLNVEILLNYAQKKQEDDKVATTDIVIDNKYGLGGINKPNRRGQLPIHLAISRNNYECVKVLIKYGCNVEYPLQNSMGKITPLMYASQLGHFKIVKLLVENNAKIEARDRFHRNSIMHASMCGHVAILSYFLRFGSIPNTQDSSGNTSLHYATAYGWYYSVKCLIEAGANVNIANDWKLTPFGAAFLKGHVGICDQLLNLYPNQIDVNFRTEDGETLVMLSVSSSNILNETNVNQLDYIVNKLNGNVKLRDSRGNNAFHYLAANRVDSGSIERLYYGNEQLIKEKQAEQEQLRVKMAEILLAAKCSPTLENNELETPFYTSLIQLNATFARYLLKEPKFGVKLSSKPIPSGQTILSLMASKCTEMDACYVIFGSDYKDLELYEKFKQEFQEMAQKKDENGQTPFQTACLKIREVIRQHNIEKVPENLTRFLVFLYRDCKSDPNKLIYTKQETTAAAESTNQQNDADSNDADDETEMEVDNESKTQSFKRQKRSKFSPPLFYLISNRSCDLIDELNTVSKNSTQIKIDFNLFDSDGLNILLKSIIEKDTKFSLKLIELEDAFATSANILSTQICKNESNLNESILQLCIRHSQFEVLNKLLDLMIKLSENKDNLDTFAQLLKHENLYKQNLLHVLAECGQNITNSSILIDFNSKIDTLFKSVPKYKSLLIDLCKCKDKLDRTPIHLCLLKSGNTNLDLEMFFLDNLFAKIDSVTKTEIFGCKDQFGRLPLHYLFIDSKFNSAKYDDKRNTLKALFKQPINLGKPNEVDVIDPVELLTLLIKLTPSNLIDEKDLFGYTTLHYAAIRGATISCSILISAGSLLLTRSKIASDIKAPENLTPDQIGNTPLSSAIYYKRETCVLQLLRSINKDIKVALNDYFYYHPKDYESQAESTVESSLSETEQDDLEQPDLKYNQTDQNDNLYVKKYIHLYELILAHKWEGISWLVLGDLSNYGLTKFDPIQSALLASQFSLALRLIEKYERELDRDDYLKLILDKSSNQFNRTLLHTIACLDWKSFGTGGDNQTLLRILGKILVQIDTNNEFKISAYLKLKDSLGSTALHYACFMLNFEFIDYLFNYTIQYSNIPQPAELLSKVKDRHQQTAYSLLFWQIGRIQYTSQFKEKIKFYTSKYLNNDLDQVSRANFPYVNIPNFKPEDSILGRLVFDYPQLDEQKLDAQISPLLHCIKKQNFDMCKFMLKELEFDVNTTDSGQVSALVYAIRTNNLNLCNLLLNFDYEINKPNKTLNAPGGVNTAGPSKNTARMKNLFGSLIPLHLQPTKPATKATPRKPIHNSDDEEISSDDLSEDNDDQTEEPMTDFNIENSQQESSIQQKSEKFSVKSNICLNRLDSKLKSVFHHLACPLEYGSYLNINICKLLFQAFVSVDDSVKCPPLNEFLKRVDSNVRTASYYAIQNGNLELYEEFKRILNITDTPKLIKFEINDKFYESNNVPDFKKDSELFLKNYFINDKKSASKNDVDYFQVDPMSNMNKIGKLVWDEKNKVPYDVIMTKTDVSYGLYGVHNFYKMQLITRSYDQTNGTKFDENQMCVLFTRWGRIGDQGQCQRTPFSNFKEAKDEFCKVFKQKTGNDFVETVIDKKKPFESKPRRYNLVKIESRVRPKLKDINFDLFDFKLKNQDFIFQNSKFKSLNDYKEFWIDLLDVEYLKNRIHLNSTLSADYLPLTQLSSENIQKAHDILNKKLKPLIEKRMELEKLSKKEHVIEYMNLLDQINKFSNDFYELIPQMNYNYEKLKPISNERELDFQISTLNQLSHAQIACRILMGAKFSMTQTPIQNPFDYVYKSLNCKLELLNPNDIETQYILRYTNPSGAKTQKFKIKRIFKFQRPDEEERFEKFDLPSGSSKNMNRLLLWHGTSTENLISIMYKGLVKSPNDARVNGHRYGKGIYFSDSFEFSSNYSAGRTHKNQSRKYILLCEVALGKIKELRTSYEIMDSLPAEFDSVKSIGRLGPDPNNKVSLPNGCVIPLGEMVQSEFKPGEYFYSRNSNENQYVVYNESQVCIRYILQYYS